MILILLHNTTIMKKLLLFTVCLCTFTMSYGQNFFTKNHTNSSSRTHALLVTSDSNYVQAGKTNSEDILVYKSTRYGDTLWMKSYGGAQMDEAVDIAESTAGGYLVLGTSESFGAGNTDILVIRMDEQGDEIWTKAYGGVWNDQAYSIANTSDGGYIITASGTNINADAWIFKIDASGVVQWEKTLTDIELSTGSNLIETSDNGFMITGKQGSNDMKLIKLTSTGDYDWARTASPVWQNEMQGVGILELSNGNFVVFGDEQSARINIFALGIDPSGNYLWGRTYRQSISSFNSVHDAVETSDGGLVLTCGFESTLGLMKIDNNGVFQWARTYFNVDLSSQGYDFRGKMFPNWSDGYIFSSNEASGIVSTDSLGMVPCYGNGTTTLNSIGNNSITTGSSASSNATSTTTDVTALQSGGFSMTRFESSNFPSPNASVTPDDCTGSGEITLNTTGGTGPYTIDWSSGCSGNTCSNLFSGNYPVLITDDTGCPVNVSIEVTHQATAQNICMVTVDPLSQHVEIIWENPVAGHIDGFNIYRHDGGTPLLIDNQDFTSPSIIGDFSAILVPNSLSYQYSITLEDTCGYESLNSPLHKTILCGVSSATGSTTTLQWNLYEGAAIDYQRIYRDPLGNGTWELIDSVDNVTNTYTDNAFFTDGRYRVEAKFVTGCSANGQAYEGSFSNIALVDDAGISEEFLSILVSPNPANDVLKVQLGSVEGTVKFQIVNTAGQVLKSTSSNNTETKINVNDLPKGLYYVRVQDAQHASTKKFVKL